MRPDHHNQPGPVEETARGLGVLLFLARCVAYPTELLTRRVGSFGEEYPGGAVTLGGLAAPLLAVLVVPPHYGAEWYGPYLFLLFALIAVNRVAARVRRQHVHRHYVGDAWFWGGRRRRGEVVLGLLVVVASVFVCDTLVFFHLASLVCGRLGLSLIEERERRVLQRMKDAELEAQYMAERFRESR